MKKIILSTLAITASFFQNANAQQWSGNNNTTDPIDRIGHVTLGNTGNPSGNLTIIGSSGGSGDGNGGWGRATSLNLNTAYAGTKLSIGSGGLGHFYIGRASSADPLTLLDLDANVRTTGTLQVSELSYFNKTVSIGQAGSTASVGLEISSPSPSIKLTHVAASSSNPWGGPSVSLNNWTFSSSIYPSCGSGSFAFTGGVGGTTKNIWSTDGNKIVFGNGINWGGCGNNGLTSKFSFDGEIGSTSLLVSAPGNPAGYPKIPTGYIFHVNGKANIKTTLVVGDAAALTNTAIAGYRLYVQDGIYTEKLKVALKADWADYVFASDYKLKSLQEVEAFVSANKHLPGIPSAEVVAKEGIDVAKMDAKLLEKIEELTLYLIQQQKQINELKSQLKK